MPKYRVMLKGLTDGSPEGRKSFLAKFAQGFKVSEAEALERVRRPGGLITAYDDEAVANKARDFLIRIGGKAEVEMEAPPAGPPEIGDENSGPAVSFQPAVTAAPAAARPRLGPPEIDFDSPGADSGPSGGALEMESAADSMASLSAAAKAEAHAPVPSRAAAGGVRPCPKCGYPVAEALDECPSCHVFISKFMKAQERKTQAAAPPEPVSPAGTRPGVPSAYAYSLSGPAPAPMEKETVPEAKTALILGIVGLFCFGFILGVFAIVNGFKAAKIIGQNPDKLAGSAMAIAGIILGFIDIIGWVAMMVSRYTGHWPF
jgi:hypothetical protein